MKKIIFTLLLLLPLFAFTGCANDKELLKDENKENTYVEDATEKEMRLKNGTVTYQEKTDVTSKYKESLNTVSEPLETIKLENNDYTYGEIVHYLINKQHTYESTNFITQIDNNVYLYYLYSMNNDSVTQDWGSALIEYNVQTLEAKLLLHYNKDDVYDIILFDEKNILICDRNNYSIYNLEKHELKVKINLCLGYYHKKQDNGIFINGSYASDNNSSLFKFHSIEYRNEVLTIYEFEVPNYNQYMNFLYYEGYFYTTNLYYQDSILKYSNIVAVSMNNENKDIATRYEEFVKAFNDKF